MNVQMNHGIFILKKWYSVIDWIDFGLVWVYMIYYQTLAAESRDALAGISPIHL